MTFVYEKERLTARDGAGVPMGFISFPQIRPGLVNIQQLTVFPNFQRQDIQPALIEALLSHLESQGKQAALTCPAAQQYVAAHPEWKRILPGCIHFEKH